MCSPDACASDTSSGRSAYVGCGWSSGSPVRTSRSTPRTPRRSVRASCAVDWMTAALARICSAVRSSRNARAPAFIEICEIRWASTSCISRAMPARSLARACATRSSCSASARSARWRSVQSSSRRDPMYMPQPRMPAVKIAFTVSVSHSGLVALAGLDPDDRLAGHHADQGR